jgi:nucleoid-associated protein YgaU
MAPEKDVLLVRESFVPLSRPAARSSAGPAPSTPAARRSYVAASKPPKNESLTSLLCGWLVEHQMGRSNSAA